MGIFNLKDEGSCTKPFEGSPFTSFPDQRHWLHVHAGGCSNSIVSDVGLQQKPVSDQLPRRRPSSTCRQDHVTCTSLVDLRSSFIADCSEDEHGLPSSSSLAVSTSPSSQYACVHDGFVYAPPWRKYPGLAFQEYDYYFRQWKLRINWSANQI